MKAMNAFFISGTGTHIGKTYLMQRLLAWDQLHSQDFQALKPVISGWPEQKEEIQHTDTCLLLKSVHQACTLETIEQISPWRYIAPLTPDMAAKAQNETICFQELVEFCQCAAKKAALAQKTVLIEGAGGLMSPITGCMTNLEWAHALNIPMILVTGSYLGALSHALTAWKALCTLNIPILAMVVNETPGSTVTLEQTCESLRAFHAFDVIALPYQINQEAAIAALYQKIQHAALQRCKSPEETII